MPNKREQKQPDHEYEVRFLHGDWNPEQVLKQASRLGADKRPRRVLLMNSIYEMEQNPDLILRVRQTVTREGFESTLTAKLPGNDRYELESETKVSDPEQTELILKMMGCRRKHATQKFRDVLEVPGLGRLDMDHHPGLPPLLEVEAPTERKLRQLLSLLGLKMPPPGPTPRPERMYEELYGVPRTRKPVGDMTYDFPSDIPKHVKKNWSAFERILGQQRSQATLLLRSAATAASKKKTKRIHR